MGTSHSMDYDVHRMTSNWFSASSSCNIIWSRSYSTQTMWNRLDTANLWSHVDNTLKMWRNVMFSKEAGWEQTLRTLCQLYVVPTNSTKNIKFPQVKNSTPKIYILDYNFIGLQSFWTISHTSPMNQSIATMWLCSNIKSTSCLFAWQVSKYSLTLGVATCVSIVTEWQHIHLVAPALFHTLIVQGRNR